MKKRNMIRIAIAAFWLIGTWGILARYRGMCGIFYGST